MDREQLRELRRHVSMVFQGGALFDSMNVFENVTYALREHTKMSDEEMLERAKECLDMVGLGYDPDIMYRFPAGLSGGMRKRAALARSIAIKPEVILYDEPTTGLDPANIKRIGEMIKKLQKELHVTSIVVTHDMPIAFKCSDRIAMLHQKKFPFIGTVDEIKNSPENNPPASQNPVKDRITKPVANATVHTRGLASARVLIGRALNSRSFRSLGSTYPYDDVFPPPGPKVTP